MPRLFIDGTMLSREAKGVGRYAYNLCLQMAKRLEAEWQIDIVVFDHDLPDFPDMFRATFHRIPYSSDLVRGLWHLPRMMRLLKSDVMLRPSDSCGTDYGLPTITVCHGINDLIDSAGGVWRGPVEGPIYYIKRFFVKRGLANSLMVICNSAYLRGAVQTHYGIPPARTTIGYCGVDERFYALAPSIDRAAVLRRYGVTRYVLTFATGDLHEGADRLPLIAMAMKRLGVDATLLIGGVKTGAVYAHELRTAFVRGGLVEGSDFIFEQFLRENRFADLVSLYTSADFYLELSRHESFGMQLAEAMACGITCLSSAADGLAEVGGEYALRIEDMSADGVAAAIAAAYKHGYERRDNSMQVAYTRRFNWEAVGARVATEIARLAPSLSSRREDP